jgi:hypothetical protein
MGDIRDSKALAHIFDLSDTNCFGKTCFFFLSESGFSGFSGFSGLKDEQDKC